jgi:Bifunctional DNA primase/polymerase, N-terminal
METIMTGCLDVDPGSAARLGLGAVALRYQQLGFAVLGLGVGSKRPHKLVRGGVSWADTDPRAVEYVWSRDKLAGIGIACGQPSGLLVIDLDRHGELDGRMVWQRFLAVNGLMAEPGPWVSTPSGGEHRYYRLPPGVTMPTRIGIMPSVDIKAQDSYVAAPPSRVRVDYDARGGGKPGSVLLPYDWHGCPCALPPAPDWMLNMIMTMPGSGGNGGSGDDSLDDLPELAELYQNGLPVGMRNITLMRLACQQYRQCKSADRLGRARAAIDRVLAATDRSGFPPAEAERTIASARAFVARIEAEEMAQWIAVYGRR